MATIVQRRRGTNAQNATFTGAEGEFVYLTDEKRVVTHDGATAGGEKQAKLSEVELVSNKSSNVALGVSNTLYPTQNAVKTYVDAASTAGAPPFTDTTPLVKGSATPTKLLRFEVDGFTAATTRVMTPPNQDATIAGLEVPQTFTVAQTFGVTGTVIDAAGKVTQYQGDLTAGGGIPIIFWSEESSFGNVYAAATPTTADDNFSGPSFPVYAAGFQFFQLQLIVSFTIVNMVSGSASINVTGHFGEPTPAIVINIPDLSVDSPLLEITTVGRIPLCAAGGVGVNFSTIAATAGGGGGTIDFTFKIVGVLMN